MGVWGVLCYGVFKAVSIGCDGLCCIIRAEHGERPIKRVVDGVDGCWSIVIPI